MNTRGAARSPLLLLGLGLALQLATPVQGSHYRGGTVSYAVSDTRRPLHEEVFFIWLTTDHDPSTTTMEEVSRKAYGYMDFKAMCAMEAAVQAAKHSNARVRNKPVLDADTV